MVRETIELAEAVLLPPSMTSKVYFQLVFCGPLHLLPIKLLFLPFCNLLFHFICLLYSFTFINQNPRLQLISFPCCCASATIFLSGEMGHLCHSLGEIIVTKCLDQYLICSEEMCKSMP